MLVPGQAAIEFSQDLGHAERLLAAGDTVRLRPNAQKINIFTADGTCSLLKDVVRYE